MEIEDAFTQEAIQVAGTNVVGEEESELRGIIAQAFGDASPATPPSIDQVFDLSVLCFVAGRTYQAHNMTVPIFMTPATLAAFTEWLIERSGVSE